MRCPCPIQSCPICSLPPPLSPQQRSGALSWEAAPGGSAGLFIPDLVFSSLPTHRSQDLAPPSGLGKSRENRAPPPPHLQPYLPYLPGYSECFYLPPSPLQDGWLAILCPLDRRGLNSSSLLVPGSLGPWFPLAPSLQAGSEDQHTPAAPI